MTTVTDFLLDAVRLDGGTQVREAIDDALVGDYAAHMADGDVFPPIVLFFDGEVYHLADGFHRYRAAQQLDKDTIAATVHPGTRRDAVWYALGANRTNGSRLTPRDVRHAIEVALQTWPDRSGMELSRQIGCSQGYFSKVRHQLIPGNTALPDRVVRSDGTTCPATYPKRVTPVHPQREEIAARLRAGDYAKDIETALNVRGEVIAEVRRELGMTTRDQSRAAVQARRQRVKEMAAEGYTSRQISAAVGLGMEAVHGIAKASGIDIFANRVVGHTRRHDPNRIISRIVMSAETLTDGSELVNYADLDRALIPDWLRALKASRDNLGAFIRRLMQEQQSHGETQ